MPDKPSVIRETDNDARRQARILLRGARFAAIGVIDPETRFPSVSRVLLGSDIDGAAVILVSGLSAHTKALTADGRTSLLAGEPGKGDPLAYPRLSVQCTAEPVERDSETHLRLRTRFLARHPKSALYIDFPDFRFFRLVPRSASLNGGFGRAYLLSEDDFIIGNPSGNLFKNEQKTLLDLGERFPNLASRIAMELHKAPSGKWAFCGFDSQGIDIIYKDLLVRHEFSAPIRTQEQLFLELPNSAYAVP
ncbi:HugZ family protein [Rhizobium sp. CECT 9324]|jgi:putative heme iron utilization protein|uniref:HugZ family pyridoxamine 5'-phosphate oxidase n=1 Tax=Rhizobium sp. CECT 9324 TaxID=2845820 RepID=UPI001E394E3C|nr:HugZ family protein [Rhizobium sp. CECT 9324]CAH0341503.1 hypothetical protein RHI9324_03199 [Rhizobium sp. CECT 9324]